MVWVCSNQHSKGSIIMTTATISKATVTATTPGTTFLAGAYVTSSSSAAAAGIFSGPASLSISPAGSSYSGNLISGGVVTGPGYSSASFSFGVSVSSNGIFPTFGVSHTAF